MSDSTMIAQSREAEARWKADYERMVARFSTCHFSFAIGPGRNRSAMTNEK